MSFGIQTQSTVSIAEMSLFAAEAEEVFQQEDLDSSLPDSPSLGGLKTASKSYTFVPKQNAPHAKETCEYVNFFGPKTATKSPEASKPSLMESFTNSYRSTTQPKADAKPQMQVAKMQNTSDSKPQTQLQQGANPAKPFSETTVTHLPIPNAKVHAENKREVARTPSRLEKTEQRQNVSNPLVARQWTKEETKEWWETRYHQRERQGGQKGRDQDQSQDEEDKKFRISKSEQVASKNSPSTPVQKESSGKAKKPELPPPKVGVFALYYLLTKIGILSDGTSNFAYKKEVELVDSETTETHKKRLEEIKEAIKKEKETERWGIATKVFSWIAAFLGIIAGIALIATGVGAVAGAMLVAGGTIQITSQIMELAGGWQKIAEILPGDDIEKKKGVISWMQIGIAVLCLILSGAGIIWGGFASFGEAMQTAMGVIGGIAAMGYGVTTIGEGISGFMFKESLAEVKKFDIRLAQLKHMRQDLMDKVELGVDRLEKLFEDLAQALEFEVELFQADQMVNRR